MTLTDELKILDGKIKANQAQYELDIFCKYGYLTGHELGYKPGVVE